MLHQFKAVTQEQTAASDGALMADARDGWALMRRMDFNAGYWTARNGAAMQPGQPSGYREGYSAGRIVNVKLQAPDDFAAAVAAYDAGERNIEHGLIDWAADEAIGS